MQVNNVLQWSILKENGNEGQRIVRQHEENWINLTAF